MPPRAPGCDLLIVGASFAGLVAAETAAMRGLDVVVLEAKPGAGARVATTGILVKLETCLSTSGAGTRKQRPRSNAGTSS